MTAAAPQFIPDEIADDRCDESKEDNLCKRERTDRGQGACGQQNGNGRNRRAGLFDEANRIPRIDRILVSDACATVTGSLCGTSTVVSYIESAAGVVAGGRSGVTAVVAGLLFIAALFVAPAVGAIPAAATAPALIIVGSMMVAHIGEIRWSDPGIAIPAFLTITTIPLTFSIANGLAFGFTAFTLIRVFQGRHREVSWFMYLLAALFLARFYYLGRA